jgi:transcriptional regulator with XRE-family HTH domain
MRHPRITQTLLREARVRAVLSQRALAQRAKTAQCAVARIELGQTDPGVQTLRRLLHAAGFDLRLAIEPRSVLDPQVLDDVPRILRLTPEDRLREVGNVNRFASAARRA